MLHHPGKRDELSYGVFNAFRDIIEINGERLSVDHAHNKAVWWAILEAVYASPFVVTRPGLSGIGHLFEIITHLRVERRADEMIYHVSVGNHPSCTVL
ncbi:MAG TPA: hypothetical protein VI981_03355 [Candidatus Paceibacterota bacterium]